MIDAKQIFDYARDCNINLVDTSPRARQQMLFDMALSNYDNILTNHIEDFIRDPQIIDEHNESYVSELVSDMDRVSEAVAKQNEFNADEVGVYKAGNMTISVGTAMGYLGNTFRMLLMYPVIKFVEAEADELVNDAIAYGADMTLKAVK